MKKQITIKHKKKRIKLTAEDCNSFRKFSGLMFSRSEKAKILLFDFKRKQNIAIHSFFVFYPFVAIWLDEKNKIVELKVVKPFKPYISSKKSAFKLIEIPINSKNNRILSLLCVTRR
jgi:uncharacterized membrane protein (UPF0127 family)